MRIGNQDYGIFNDEDGKFIGISLGYDYCAEHEWGHDDIKRDFGIPELSKKTLGIKSRSITKCIDNLIFKKQTYKKKKFAILYTGSSWRTRDEMEEHLPHYLENYKKDIERQIEWDTNNSNKDEKIKDPIKTAWSGGSFGVGVMGVENVEHLHELYQAFLNKNVAIAYVNHRAYNPFSNNSLTLMIADRIPKKITDMIYAADKEHHDLITYEKKIGMTKLKKKTRSSSYDNRYGHQHGYYLACSARWIDYDDKESREAKKENYHTKYDIQYLINYSDDDNTHGYFNVEEIKKWLKGKKKLSEIRKENEEKYEK